MSRSPRLWAMRTAFRAVGAVAPGVAARWTGTLFCTPPRRPGGDEAFLASGTPFTLRSQGQRLAGWEWGRGPTVVLVHGWGGRASRFGTLGRGLLRSRELPAAALVIHDRDDTDVPLTHGEEIVGAWAGSRLETTTGLGHRTLFRDPSVIARAVAFLSEGVPG